MAVANNTAKLVCGVSVDMICSNANAASPGIAYRCATEYMLRALAGGGSGIGCGCGSADEAEGRPPPRGAWGDMGKCVTGGMVSETGLAVR